MIEKRDFQTCPQCQGMMVISKDKRYWECKCGNAILIKKHGIEKKVPEVQRR